MEHTRAPRARQGAATCDVGVTAFGIHGLVFAPGAGGRMHFHEHHEDAYVVLAGQLAVAFEDGSPDPWRADRS
jgi:uncharacterized RmlC-like cupin family protein